MGIAGVIEQIVVLEIPQPLLLIRRNRVVGVGRHGVGSAGRGWKRRRP
jgi:hypothetical protein